MAKLRAVTFLFALLLAGGEIARWWAQARFLPMALDELLVAAAMIWATAAAPRHGTAPLAVAWGLFCGLTLALLIPTLDHLLFGPAKASAGFYSAVLAGMLVIGLLALLRAFVLLRSR